MAVQLGFGNFVTMILSRLCVYRFCSQPVSRAVAGLGTAFDCVYSVTADCIYSLGTLVCAHSKNNVQEKLVFDLPIGGWFVVCMYNMVASWLMAGLCTTATALVASQ